MTGERRTVDLREECNSPFDLSSALSPAETGVLKAMPGAKACGDDAVGVLEADDLAGGELGPGVDEGAAGGDMDGGAIGRNHVLAGRAMGGAAGDL